VRDIYFPEQEIATQTREHIMLNCLGGRLESADLIDAGTNHRFGSGIDRALERVISPIRLLLDAPAGDGTTPHGLKNLPLTDGRVIGLAERGRPVGDQRVSITSQPDGSVRVSGSHTEVRKLLKKHKLPAQELLGGATTVREHLPPVTIKGGFDNDARRCLAKMACNLFAFTYRDLFLRSEFDAVRSFVTGTGEPDAHVVTNVDSVDIGPPGWDMGALDHLILIRGHAATGHVEALVVLYKHLQFAVYLGRTALPVDIRLSYRVAQVERQHRRDDALDRMLVVPNFESCRQRQAQAAVVVEREARALFEQVDRHQYTMWVEDLIEECAVEAFGRTDVAPDEVTEDQVAHFVTLVKERYSASITNILMTSMPSTP